MTEFDLSKLRGRIIEIFRTQSNFAQKIGRTSAYVSMVLNGKAYLEAADISRWAEALLIPVDEIGAYFFTLKVHET